MGAFVGLFPRQRDNQPTNEMRTLKHKIAIEANRISREYIDTLQRGYEPASLASMVQAQRYGIMDNIRDGRANMTDTIEKVRRHAHSLIKMDLEANPDLAQRLIAFRGAKAARDEQIAREEQRSWRPLPAIGKMMTIAS
jgi:hypothetical protein